MPLQKEILKSTYFYTWFSWANNDFSLSKIVENKHQMLHTSVNLFLWNPFSNFGLKLALYLIKYVVKITI